MSILQGLDPQAIAKAFDPKNAIDVADYKNCKLIECQKCGFRFDAAHCFSDGTYDCPVCNESDLGAQLVALEKRIAELERERDAAIAELDNVKKHYRSVIGDKIMRLEAECDAANKRAEQAEMLLRVQSKTSKELNEYLVKMENKFNAATLRAEHAEENFSKERQRAEQAEAHAHLLAFAVQTGQRIEGLFEVASKYYVSPPPAQEYKKLGE